MLKEGREQVLAAVVPKGPTGAVLNSSFKTRECSNYIDELGNLLVNCSRLIPDGLLVFFPSYSALNSALARWKVCPNRRPRVVTSVGASGKMVVCRSLPPLTEAPLTSLCTGRAWAAGRGRVGAAGQEQGALCGAEGFRGLQGHRGRLHRGGPSPRLPALPSQTGPRSLVPLMLDGLRHQRRCQTGSVGRASKCRPLLGSRGRAAVRAEPVCRRSQPVLFGRWTAAGPAPFCSPCAGRSCWGTALFGAYRAL